MSVLSEYEVDRFLRGLSDATVAHLARAFENARVPDGRGGVLAARAPDVIGRVTAFSVEMMLEADVSKVKDPVFYRGLFAYSWYLVQFSRGASGMRPAGYDGELLDTVIYVSSGGGGRSWMSEDANEPVEPEARLALMVNGIGHQISSSIPDGTTDYARVRDRVVESVRKALNWPTLPSYPADFPSPPPSQWPVGLE